MRAETSGGSATVFVGYVAADRPWAEWVAWHLTECGYDPTLAAWHAVPGSSSAAWLDHDRSGRPRRAGRRGRTRDGLRATDYARRRRDRRPRGRLRRFLLDAEDPYEQARSHAGLGHAHHRLGELGAARRGWEQARTIYAHLGAPEIGEADRALRDLTRPSV
ncbi:toll/interleukin-1 receptor domain-containing protein [Frankia gtarii]|uniref:toll/interleukin-1 receptor domain-containing protein n=1 Tax=Frankia gtarii TaxID=2950102 RepID=UPI0021C18762|nr:toll/interleukin-1 receptor domain-containing protein [Frankia gtarii]